MFEATFSVPARFGRSVDLQSAFGTEAIRLAPGAEVTMSGRIRLGNEVEFRGRCRIGDGTCIDNGSILTDVALGLGNRVRPYSILSAVQAGDRNLFGPFCFIRDDSIVGDDCILAAHVEAARAVFGSGVKISHRAFVGDATVADEVIIGAGVVFCNWDGGGRQPTHIARGALIGSGTMLVPPLEVGEGAVIAAGSTVTRSVAAGARIIQRRG